MSLEEVLVYTRLAGDKVGATKMDRPEDVEPSPVTGKLYIALTNNTQRNTTGKATVDEANPRTKQPRRPRHRADRTPQRCGGDLVQLEHPAGRRGSRQGREHLLLRIPEGEGLPDLLPGQPGLRFEGQPLDLHRRPARNHRLLRRPAQGHPDGPDRGKVEQFLAVPAGAETCGPLIHDRDGSVFVAVQHPGEGGTFNDPTSFFPDYVLSPAKAKRGEVYGPRPSVVQVFTSAKGHGHGRGQERAIGSSHGSVPGPARP